MKHIIPLILTLSLLGCQTPPADMTPPAPTASHPPIPTTAPTLTPTPTEVPLEALPVEEIVQKYLAGEIDDVSGLNFEQQKAFSIALDEKRDERRGDNPIIYTDRNGSTTEQQTIDNTLPRVIDGEGYTHVYYNGEWVKIAGSDKIQFNNFDNFPWPNGEPVDPKYVPEEYRHLLGKTAPEYMYQSEDVNMAPIFFLGKEYSETDIAGRRIKGTLLGYVITEDDPYSVISTKVTGNPPLYTDSSRVGSGGNIVEGSSFYKAIVSGDLYYLMYMVDQPKSFASTYPNTEGQEATIKYKGLAPSTQTHVIITGQTKSNDIPLVNTLLFVKAGE